MAEFIFEEREYQSRAVEQAVAFFDHGGFRALVKQLLAVAGGIDIQKQQYHHGDTHIYQRITKLHIAVSAPGCPITCGSNSQRPTSS